MPIIQEKVATLGEYMEKISEIAEESAKSLAKELLDKKLLKKGQLKMEPPVLWFRAQPHVAYDLAPKLFRSGTRAEKGGKYTPLHYAEDIKTQHYIAKNYHLLSKAPSSRVEWLEVMQHHELGTRLLDWSESSIHSLLFAVEAFLNEKYTDDARKTCVPCVWVVEPGKLNKKIVESLRKNGDLIDDLLTDLCLTRKEMGKIKDNIDLYGNFDIYAETEETRHMDYIYNLSSINDEILRDRSRVKQLLIAGEVINPYYYLLARIYSDGYLLDKRTLPPLAVVQSYHSERIKTQRGVFTVYPFYEEQSGDDILRDNGVNPDAMNHNRLAQNCLHQIIIENPQKVALQLMENGMYDSWLYPEMPVVSAEIEKHMVL